MEYKLISTLARFWYRALIQSLPARAKPSQISVPTLLFLGRELAQPSIELCDNGRLVFIEKASHWIQHEESAQVNELLSTFLQ